MIRAILMDIEGTTTSVAFVYDVLFPYFGRHLPELSSLRGIPEADDCFEEIKSALKARGIAAPNDSDVIDQLQQWLDQDKKETSLKTLQGLVWQKAYQDGSIKGHVYPDVPPKLAEWKDQGLSLNIYSSGSVAAQKLLFGYSEYGDLTPYFSHYFDTRIGAKRDPDSYRAICSELKLGTDQVLFLSDIEAELDAAHTAGLGTLQLVRPGTEASPSHPGVRDFSGITLD